MPAPFSGQRLPQLFVSRSTRVEQFDGHVTIRAMKSIHAKAPSLRPDLEICAFGQCGARSWRWLLGSGSRAWRNAVETNITGMLDLIQRVGRDMHAHFGEQVPMKRPAQPSELVYVILASEEASYVSGATVAVIGGKTII